MTTKKLPGPFCWVGAKNRMRSKIAPILEEARRGRPVYVEPFGGSAATSLALEPVNREVYNEPVNREVYNDPANREVHNDPANREVHNDPANREVYNDADGRLADFFRALAEPETLDATKRYAAPF